MRFFLLAPLLLCAASAAPAQVMSIGSDRAPVPDKVDHSSQARDVKFRNDINSRMTVAVTLHGMGPYRFMVDTGADRTAISRELAAQLGLPQGEAVQMHSLTGASMVQTAKLSSLQLSGGKFPVDEAALLSAANIGADGILGVDTLQSQRVIFDFRHNVMTIEPSSDPVSREDRHAIAINGRIKNGRLVITSAVADGREATVVIDTGSEVTIGNQALRRSLLGDRPVTPATMVQLQSVTGDLISGEYAIIDRLDIGGAGMKHLVVVFADAHTFKELGLEDRPAMLLGMNALRPFDRVSIDFARRKLRVLLPQEGSLPQLMLAAR